MSDLTPVAGFDDVRQLLRQLPSVDEAALAACAEREAMLTKPASALGRLEEVAAWAAGWQGRHPPRLERAEVVVFAGNHGVAARGVSAYPPEVTAQMVAAFEAGTAAINQLCRAAGAVLRVHALDLKTPTRDFTRKPAMDEPACLAAINAGMAAVDGDLDVIAVGEMGIGNTTSAAAIYAALYGGVGADWAGSGTGVDPAGMARKTAAIDAGLARHRDRLDDPLAVLSVFGGRETAAIAGAVLAARLRRVPVLLDGYVATAAAAVLRAVEPSALDHCRAAHLSAEPAHGRVLIELGLKPLLRLDMRLGEASGAALAVPLVRAAVACHAGMATFAEARVSDRAKSRPQKM